MSLLQQSRRIALVALASAMSAMSAVSVAQAHEAYGAGSEILSELPANAPPGECYAKVTVPGERRAPPPQVSTGAYWTMTPGPGGPVWCLVSASGQVISAPEETVTRDGWIRVLCDTDATPARITKVQHSLHDRGLYRGDYSGHYDKATVQAVSQFQSGANIRHGGYLSVQTVEALEGSTGGYDYPAPAPSYPGPQTYGSSGGGYASSYSYDSGSTYTGGGYAQAYAPPISPCAQTCGAVYAPPPPPPPPVYIPPSSPCCTQPIPQPSPCCAGGGYASGGYASGGYASGAAYGTGYLSGYVSGYSPYGYGAQTPTPAYVSGRSAVVNGWLTWPGKSGF